MKQLYYTSCRADRSLDGRSGFNVRAISPGGGDGHQATIRHAGYRLPPGMPPDTPAAEAPPRLAFLQTREAGRLLCHSVYVGQDPTTGRYGNFFSHLLFDVPAQFDACAAAESWESAFWRRADDDGEVHLPEVATVPRGSVLTDSALAAFLADPQHQELLRFVLAAILTGDANRRVFLAAPPTTVMFCVFGAIRCLPPPLSAGITFSSYECEPLTCAARIVGTCWQGSYDLPTSCYSGNSLAYNTYSGRKTDVPAVAPYVDAAVAACASGHRSDLVAFFDSWTQLELSGERNVNLAFRVALGTGEVTRQDAAECFAQPGLATLFARRPGTLGHVADWALEDAAFARTEAPRLIQALQGSPVMLQQLGDLIWSRCRTAIGEGRLSEVQLALEQVLPRVAPGRDWPDELWSVLSAPPADWPTRAYLTPRLITRDRAVKSPQVQAWLGVPPAQLGELLAMRLPREHRVAACLLALAEGSAPAPAAVQAVAAQPDLWVDLVEQLAGQPQGEPRAAALWDALLGQTRQRRVIEDLAARIGDRRPELFDRCLGTALEQDCVDPQRLIAAQGTMLAAILPRSRHLAGLVEKLFAADAAAADSDQTVTEFLAFFQESAAMDSLSPQAKQRLTSYVGLEQFLKEPTLDEAPLRLVAGALQQIPPGTQRQQRSKQLLETIVERLLQWPGTAADSQAALENVLAGLGGSLAETPAALYGELTDCCRRSKPFWKRPELMAALVAVGFGATRRSEIAEALDGEYLTAARLAAEIRARVPNRVYQSVEEATRGWARTQQKFWEIAADRGRASRRYLRLTLEQWLLVAYGVAFLLVVLAWWLTR